MSTGYARDIRSIPGRLVANPTDLSAAYPYGGTELGIVRSIAVDLSLRVRFVQSEAAGGGPLRKLRLGQASALTAVLRTWDADMVATLFPNTQIEDGLPVQINSDRPGSGETGDFDRIGTWGDDDEIVLLFAPFAPLTHEAFIMYRASPHTEEAAKMQLSLTKEIGLAVAFMGLTDDSGRRHRHALLEKLSL